MRWKCRKGRLGIHHSVTPPCDTGAVRRAERHPTPGEGRPRLTLLAGGAPASQAGQDSLPDADEEAFLRLAAEVALLLAAAPEGDTVHAPLAIPLALSACMARHCVDAEGLIDAMLPLRRALIAVSDLDAASEPVPLATGEPTDAALSLASYLHGLLARAEAASARHRGELASAAADRLRSA